MIAVKRERLHDGVHFTSCGGGFKRSRMTVFLRFPLSRGSLTPSALLPYIMTRGTKSVPDTVMLKRMLERMYGSSLDADFITHGMSRIVSVSVTGPDASLLGEGGENVRRAGLLLDAVLAPYTEGGAFKPEWVEIEKDKLRDEIRSVANDKRELCLRRLDSAAYDDERGLPEDGFEEDIDGITPQRLYEAYKKILNESDIEIFFAGECPEEIRELCRQRFEGVKTEGADIAAPRPIVYDSVRTVSQTLPVEQDKLAVLYSTGRVEKGASRAALRAGIEIFGGSATSRLFNNVREKKSLCYYIGARYSHTPGGGMYADCGVSHENAETALRAVDEELEAFVKTGPTRDELLNNRLFFRSVYGSVGDNASGLIGYCFSRLLEDGEITEPERELELVEKATAGEIVEAMSRLKKRAVSAITA